MPLKRAERGAESWLKEGSKVGFHDSIKVYSVWKWVFELEHLGRF